MQCQHESNRYESMMDLAVEIHGVVESLEDAISQFTTTEMLDGENKYKCDRCVQSTISLFQLGGYFYNPFANRINISFEVVLG